MSEESQQAVEHDWGGTPVCAGPRTCRLLDDDRAWSKVADDLVLVEGWGIGVLRNIDAAENFWVTFAVPGLALSWVFDPDDDDFELLPWPTGKKDWTLGEVAEHNATAERLRNADPGIETIKSESDRGVVIASAEAVNKSLARLLKNRLPEPVPARVVGDRQGDLSLRIDVAHAAGLLPPMLRESLQLIAKLRNAVAHASNSVSPNEGEARNMLGQLPAWRALKQDGVPPRTVFTMVVGFVVAWLDASATGPRLGTPADLPPETWRMTHDAGKAVEAALTDVSARLDDLIGATRGGGKMRSAKRRAR